MSILVTLLVGGLGGAVAFLLDLPVPWLVGSLLIMIACRKVDFIKAPTKTFSRWMRVVLGMALGASVAQSIQVFNPAIISLLIFVIAFVCIISLVGYRYFQTLPGFSNTDSFMSSLPGGMTFLMSLSDDLGDKFPKIALIHTIRMVFLILCFSLMAYFIGVDNGPGETIQSSFSFVFDPLLWQVGAFAFVMGSLSDKLKIAGGHIMFPMIASAIFYSQGWISVPVPEIFQTLAMITFGAAIGSKLSNVSLREYKQYVRSSVVFTTIAMAVALLIAFALSEVLSLHYFLIFLALAPGSIAEISLIALALGFDVGVVALVHTCRYLFIMFIGAYGLNFFRSNESQKPIEEGSKASA